MSVLQAFVDGIGKAAGTGKVTRCDMGWKTLKALRAEIVGSGAATLAGGVESTVTRPDSYAGMLCGVEVWMDDNTAERMDFSA